ncbi:hypothetical protein F5J12DRAFT_818529 [Pisolithus orientalis]|uniref:uncharacterized protein n=1 Tax=Pisolithus orientalis TaxID=936130 RepID=UPI00222527C2|nr:uncharacterized protein F5J12DRAFT_818529 [Pisolithus orientalis]KAI6012535.1 hypothetical protein F5J12DRAFT_818529 [Pisolithus orientalis]
MTITLLGATFCSSFLNACRGETKQTPFHFVPGTQPSEWGRIQPSHLGASGNAYLDSEQMRRGGVARSANWEAMASASWPCDVNALTTSLTIRTSWLPVIVSWKLPAP